jgi:hypothetical protein
MGRDWLVCLIRYAPTIDSLAAMFDDAFVTKHISEFLPDLSEWIRGINWTNTDEIKVTVSSLFAVPHVLAVVSFLIFSYITFH